MYSLSMVKFFVFVNMRSSSCLLFVYYLCMVLCKEKKASLLSIFVSCLFGENCAKVLCNEIWHIAFFRQCHIMLVCPMYRKVRVVPAL